MTTERLTAGMTAPDFTLPDTDGNPVSLHDLRGSKVVLYFYPAASTPACTTEACDFRDGSDSLAARGYRIIGVSKDEPAANAAFAAAEGLRFPLLSDPDLSVQQAYAVWGEKSLYGKTVTGSIRSTFVLDEHGVIVHALYNVKATGHVARIRRMLGAA